MNKLILTILLTISCCFNFSSSCGGGGRKPPPRCSWRTCSARYDAHFSPAPPSTGGCVTQVKRCHHQYQTHHRNGGCPRSQSCHQKNIHRQWCNCKYQEYNGGWGDWEQTAKNGKCVTETRKTKFTKEIMRYNQANCNVKGNQRVETRVKCECEVYSYRSKGFGSWKDVAGQEHLKCKEQYRVMEYIRDTRTETHDNRCPSVNLPPSNLEKQTRKACLCKVNHFIEVEWSDWKDIAGQGDKECIDQERKMVYEKSGVTADYKEKCPPLLEQPENPKTETRNICRPCKVFKFTYEQWSDWLPTPETSSNGCKIEKRKRKGNFTRERTQKVDGECPKSEKYAPTEFRESC